MSLIFFSNKVNNTDEIILESYSLYKDIYNLQEGEKSHVEIIREGGIPQISGFSGYISVSHSSDVFVCIIDLEPVGIDIEKHKDINFRCISKRFFSFEPNDILDFYNHWCAAETITKSKNISLVNALKMELKSEVKYIQAMEGFTICYKSNSEPLIYFQI